MSERQLSALCDRLVQRVGRGRYVAM